MTVFFFTSDAQTLLDSFDEKIEQEERKGKITTWEKMLAEAIRMYPPIGIRRHDLGCGPQY